MKARLTDKVKRFSGKAMPYPRMPIRVLIAAILLTTLLHAEVGPQAHLLTARKMAAAHQTEAAEKELKLALVSVDLTLAEIAIAENRAQDGRVLYQEAAAIRGNSKLVALGLARVNLLLNDPAAAIVALQKAIAIYPRDMELHRSMGEACAASGNAGRALGEFEQALRLKPKDPQTLYLAGTAALTLHNLSKAQAMYYALLASVPGAATHVLIGRLYRDFGHDPEATSQLRRALSINPHARRAHYYLGTIAVIREGAVRLEDAESEFRQELALAPDDYSSNLYLGVVLTQERRYVEAEPFLVKAVALEPTSPDGLVFLARVYFEQKRYAQVVDAAERAIALTTNPASSHFQIANTHYTLAQAWRSLGEKAKAEGEFSIARQLKEQATKTSRDEMQDYFRNSIKEAQSTTEVRLQFLAQTADPAGAAIDRKERERLEDLLAEIRFELGNFYVHEQRNDEAVSEFSALFHSRPDFPGLKKTYGAALVGANRTGEAIPILKSLLNNLPEDMDVRRMLGHAYFQAEDYANVISVLGERDWRDIPTQYVLATALARTGQDDAAKDAFAKLLWKNPRSAELQALLGQAAAQQKDYAAAIFYYKEALALDSTVPEAHLGIGLIAMRNGDLKGAEKELQTEVRAHPGDLRAKYYLAYVVGLSQRHADAEKLLREILAKRADFPDAHAALGKELFAEDKPAQALQELLIADKLAPSQPRLLYQLGLVYRKLGRMEDAQQAFLRYRELRTPATPIAPSQQSEDGHNE